MTKMMGAICGDILGSSFEANNIKHIPTLEEISSRRCRFTDDTIMTCAAAHGMVNALHRLPENWKLDKESEDIICREIQKSLIEFGEKYPFAGYGFGFEEWLFAKYRRPYNSWGNGSAMRVSYAGWIARNFEEAMFWAKCSAQITHNHEEGIKGAQVVAACIYFLRMGKNKDFIRKFVSEYYNVNFSLNDIRDSYGFEVSCQGSVPQAIVAFLEGSSFQEVIFLAISIGGDSDTIAAIAGSLAEVIYDIPEDCMKIVNNVLDEYLKGIIRNVVDELRK